MKCCTFDNTKSRSAWCVLKGAPAHATLMLHRLCDIVGDSDDLQLTLAYPQPPLQRCTP